MPRGYQNENEKLKYLFDMISERFFSSQNVFFISERCEYDFHKLLSLLLILMRHYRKKFRIIVIQTYESRLFFMRHFSPFFSNPHF